MISELKESSVSTSRIFLEWLRISMRLRRLDHGFDVRADIVVLGSPAKVLPTLRLDGKIEFSFPSAPAMLR